jgi:uncharacterized membrane protein YcaP (DUF421 family)
MPRAPAPESGVSAAPELRLVFAPSDTSSPSIGLFAVGIGRVITLLCGSTSIFQCTLEDVKMLEQLALQAAKAAAYYIALIVLMRVAGKRLAGQTTTFDLIVLITLGVVLQSIALQEGASSGIMFVLTVFAMHRLTAFVCTQSTFARHLIRGKPRVLVRAGRIIEEALRAEGISEAELLAGLRKLGYEKPEDVKLATLEETGHISAVGD